MQPDYIPGHSLKLKQTSRGRGLPSLGVIGTIGRANIKYYGYVHIVMEHK